MIEYLDPRRIKTTNPDLWMEAGWSYKLDYSWIIEKAVKHGGSRIVDAGCGVMPYSPLGGRISKLLNATCVGVDRIFGHDFEGYWPEEAPDIIFWASSLEHNKPIRMRELYRHSLEILKLGGLFLATITMSSTSFWFEPSANSCLTEDELKFIFDESSIDGKYWDVWRAYREDDFIARKYRDRYGHFTENDPAFVIAGVEKINERK